MALRFVPIGDIEAAGRLKGVGWRLLHDLKRRMSFQNLFQDRAVLRSEDGIIIECLVCGALDTISVFVPVLVMPVEKEITVEIELLKYRIYCVLIEYDWWKGGDVTGYVLPEEAYKQIYLKVDNNGDISELQESEIQDFVLKTPISEFKMRERIVNKESAHTIKDYYASTDISACSQLKDYSTYLYTPNLPVATWSYLLKMPDGKTLGIMGTNTGIAAWNDQDTMVEYKAILRRYVYEQSEHYTAGYSYEYIILWSGVSNCYNAFSSHGTPHWISNKGIVAGYVYPPEYWAEDESWSFWGWGFLSEKNESISVQTVIDKLGITEHEKPDGTGLTGCNKNAVIVRSHETGLGNPSVTTYYCNSIDYEDHQPNIEDGNEISSFLNFENNYRIFEIQKYIGGVTAGQKWINSPEGLILASIGVNNTIIMKLSEPESTYVRIEYNDGNIDSLEIIEGEVPELPSIVYNSMSDVKKYNPILADLYSCIANDRVIINQYLEKANTPFLLLPKTGFANYNIIEKPLSIPVGGR